MANIKKSITISIVGEIFDQDRLFSQIAKSLILVLSNIHL